MCRDATAGLYADRLSANIELPTQQDLVQLAPEKKTTVIETAMSQIHTRKTELDEDRRRIRSTPKFAPAGQSTQMVVGATPSTDAQILAMVGQSSQSNRIDRDLWTKDATNVTSGNHVATVVSFEMTGNSNVQRFPGFLTTTTLGAGFGDLNFNNTYAPDDVTAFSNVFNSNNTQFNPAADLDGDGRVGESDLLLLGPRYTAVNASPATKQSYNNLLINPSTGNTRTVTALFDNSSGSSLSKTSAGTLNLNGPQSHGANASLFISNGIINFNSDAGSSSAANLALTISGAGTVNFTHTQHLSRLTINSANATSSADLIDTKSLSIDLTGNLDLNRSDGREHPASLRVVRSGLDVFQGETRFAARQGDQGETAQSLRAIAAIVIQVAFGLHQNATPIAGQQAHRQMIGQSAGGKPHSSLLAQ